MSDAESTVENLPVIEAQEDHLMMRWSPKGGCSLEVSGGIPSGPKIWII